MRYINSRFTYLLKRSGPGFYPDTLGLGGSSRHWEGDMLGVAENFLLHK